jgi:hypothetical protein
MLRWFSQLKIARKLTLGFGLVLLLMTTTLVTDVLASRQQTSVEEQLVDRLYPSRQAANEIVTLVYAANDARLVYVVGDNEHAAGGHKKRAPSCSSTSTISRASTTRWVTRPGMPSYARSASGSRAACAWKISWDAMGERNSPSC